MVVQPTLVENFLVVIGESAWVFSAGAQLIRLNRTRDPRGLSAVTQTLNAAGNIGWCTYFAMNHLWFPFVTNILLLLLTVGILNFTLHNRRQFFRGVVAILIIGPLTGIVLSKFPLASGWMAVAYNWIASVPWMVRVIRTKKTSGISAYSLYWSIVAMSFTLTYALLIHSVPLITTCIEGLLYQAVIMRYYYRYRKRSR
jgi:uncharacterized protein with PQ loop repeat